MIPFWRYEKEDGGGPFFTRDGRNRITGEQCDDDTLDGALSYSDLRRWFKGKEQVIEDCFPVRYIGELMNVNRKTGNAIFRKSTAIKL